MATISYDKKCNKNKDCKSNVCEMIYQNSKPMGRFCLTNSNDKYTKKCISSKDCMSGICKKIYDSNGHFVVKKCVKAPKVDTDSSFDSLFGKSRSDEYGVMNSSAIKLSIGEHGPITEIIIKVFSIIGDLFSIIVFNFDACGNSRRKSEKKCGNSISKVDIYGKCSKRANDECNVMEELDEQGILYILWRTIFDAVFGIFGGIQQGWIWGAIQHKYYDKCANKCKPGSNTLDLWYIRTFITVLFPPFGVLMARGINGFPYILLSCILTAMFYFPGLIYSFAVINSSKLEIQEKKEISKK